MKLGNTSKSILIAIVASFFIFLFINQGSPLTGEQRTHFGIGKNNPSGILSGTFFHNDSKHFETNAIFSAGLLFFALTFENVIPAIAATSIMWIALTLLLMNIVLTFLPLTDYSVGLSSFLYMILGSLIVKFLRGKKEFVNETKQWSREKKVVFGIITSLILVWLVLGLIADFDIFKDPNDRLHLMGLIFGIASELIRSVLASRKR